MMLDEENEFLEEIQETESQENVPPILPIPTPIVTPQPVDDYRCSKDVTIFSMDIITEHIVDARW